MAIPTMIQHISAASNPLGGPSGNAFKIPITHPVGAGNGIILCITFTSGLTATITDNNSNTWTGTLITTADGGGTFGKSQGYFLPNANAGQTLITVTFGSASAMFTYTVSEWMNLATASAVDGASMVGFNQTVYNCPAAPYATGSFTPAYATGTDLIFAYFCYNGNNQQGTPTNWVPGSGFTLLDGDLGSGLTGGSGAGGLPHATIYQIATSGAVNPSVTMTGDTSDTVNAIGFALKAASAGTPRAAGMHADRVIHQTSNQATGTMFSRCVFTGNLRVIVFGFTRSNEADVTGITDSDGNTWVDATGGSTTLPLVYYKQNASPSANTLITMATTGTASTAQNSWRIWDFSGADPSAFDTYVGVPQTSFSTGSVSNAPSITPGFSGNGVTLATCLVAFGNGHSVTAPTNAVYDACDYTGNASTDQLENADCFGHYFFSNNTQQNWAWTMTANGGNSYWAGAATFKAAATATYQPYDPWPLWGPLVAR